MIDSETLLSDPLDQTIQIDMNTEYLARTYEKFLTKESLRTKDFYIENTLPEGNFRSYRYLASIATVKTPQAPIQSLAKVYCEEGNIWEKNLGQEDLENVDKAIALVKLSYDSARLGNGPIGDVPIDMHRDITISDGTSVGVEYVPYSEDRTDRILGDMNQHIEVAE